MKYPGQSKSAETLGHWAERMGISYRTAWRWHRDRRFPAGVTAEQMPTGTILVTDRRSTGKPKGVGEAIIYARINPRENSKALEEQVGVCRLFCVARGWTVSRVVRERAPGIGARRTKLGRLVEERPERLVVATSSILSRFDFSFCEALWTNLGTELVVVDRSEETRGKGGALEDLTDAINLTCHRHYGPKKGTALVEMLSRVVEGKIGI